MKFHFTDEQEQFRDMVRRFLAATSSTTEVRRLMATESGFDAGVWQRLAGELGVTGLMIPEQYGGAGFGVVELGIVMEEMGRALLCAPFLSSSVLAANALVRAADEDTRSRLLPAVASGERIATLAWSEPGRGPDFEDVAMVAQQHGGAWRLNGSKRVVLDGCAADLVLVVARLAGTRGADGLTLFEVPVDGPGVTRRALNVIDPTRKLAELTFDQAAATPLCSPGGAADALRQTFDVAAVALASEMVGGAARLFEDTLEYTRIRVQFGRPIASFQAIKHRCAEILLDVELARSAAYAAAEATDEDDPRASYLSSLAKAGAADAYMRTAAEAIQLHGGIGFTFEQDTHLWFKRAKASEMLLGDPPWHRERMIRLLEDAQSTAEQQVQQQRQQQSKPGRARQEAT